jgi:hypothetical protein
MRNLDVDRAGQVALSLRNSGVQGLARPHTLKCAKHTGVTTLIQPLYPVNLHAPTPTPTTLKHTDPLDPIYLTHGILPQRELRTSQ